jgi:adenylosuccinate synthase
LPQLRYSNQINGTDWLVITKLDVLDDLEWIPVCTGYQIDGKALETMPADVRGIEAIRPVYTRLRGWKRSTEGVRNFEDLPKPAQVYLRFMERETGAKIALVSTGPDRDQTLEMPEFREAMERIAGQTLIGGERVAESIQ